MGLASEIKRTAVTKSICGRTEGSLFVSLERWRSGESLHFEPFNPFSNKTLDGGKYFKILGRNKCKSIASLLGAARAADAVNVVLRMLRHIVVDDVADAGDIDSSGGDVGRNHDLIFSRL